MFVSSNLQTLRSNPSPIIVSNENHGSQPNQKKVVSIMGWVKYSNFTPSGT